MQKSKVDLQTNEVSKVPSGKLLHNELERSTIVHGKIHYFYGDFP